MIAVSVLIVWRHRWPIALSIAAICLTLVVPTTLLPVLILVAATSAVTIGWTRWAFILGTYAAAVSSLAWDVFARTSLLSAFVNSPAAGTPARLGLLWAVPVVAAMLVAPFVAYGIARRLRIERDTAQHGTAAATRNVAVLERTVEVERQRQEIARELHDTLAARLSQISLHAGALELSAAGDERTATAARAVRESAQSSMDDLHQVVRALRHPESATSTNTGLSDLAGLVDDVLRDGTDIRAQLLITDPSSCDPRVAHSSYRLVQEAVSNARRHAPGASIFLDLRGGPQTGLTISVTSWLVPGGHALHLGGGHGLAGMSERVGLVGGRFQAGATAESAFAVLAWLPWSPR